MSDIFSDAANAVVSGQPSEAAPSQSENQQDLSPSTESNLQSASDGAPKGDVAMAIAELDKMDKFKLDGQEWTLKDLKAAIMRQKDYTQKTQTLAEERKSFQEERKFHENLAWDLQKVRENPELAKEFVRVYPQGFHKHVAEFLKTSNSQSSPQPQVQQPQVDVQLLSRLQTLENYYHQQEVSRQQTEIEKMAGELAKEYPDAGNAMKMVYAMAYEAQLEAKNNGRDLTRDDWESIFKSERYSM
jgi:hypothetical protein